MRQVLRRGWVRLIVAAVLVGFVVIAGFGVYLLNVAGDLPWQVDPTRIPITPFADIPGFTPPPVVVVATPTGIIEAGTPAP